MATFCVWFNSVYTVGVVSLECLDMDQLVRAATPAIYLPGIKRRWINY